MEVVEETSGKGDKEGNMESMNMTEMTRLLLGLRAAGWTEKEINDFLLYIESGDEQYIPVRHNREAGKGEHDGEYDR